MNKTYDDKISSWWEGTLKITERIMKYRFLILQDGNMLWYNAAGLTGALPTDECDFRIVAGDRHPAWVDNSVFYQIFPDRFCRGARTPGDQVYEYDGHTRIEREWGEAPLTHELAGNIDFFGGNLNGITERLDYLTDLGVNAVYLNPIFTAPSNHKYDCVDYFNVDPTLGGNESFKRLTEELRGRDIKIILDITPNHCGILHPWFQQAIKDRAAESAEFFTFYTHPHEYEMWKGVKTLPKLNYRSQRLRDLMYRSSDSVVSRWMGPPWRIDGWRIDVANMLARQGAAQYGHEVGREIREAVKGRNEDAYLVGEHFFDGTSHLQGDELDGAMNYQGFAFPFWNWLAPQDLWWMKGFQQHRVSRLSTADMTGAWRNFMAAVPWITTRRQFNFLGNHDTPRILHVVEWNRRLAMAAAAVLFTFPGVPSIYYGDEAGLSGKRDPGCRECMPWKPEAWNMELRQLYQKLVSLKRTSPALAHGGFEMLMVEEDLFSFKREVFEEIIIVIVNRSPATQNGVTIKAGIHGIAENRVFADLFGEGSYRVKEGILEIPSVSGESFLILRSAFQ